MNENQTELPGLWRLAWMLFMQPVSLHYRLKACGIKETDASAWKLWRTAGPDQTIRRSYMRRMFAILLILTPVGAIVLVGLLGFLGFPVNLEEVAGGGGAYKCRFCSLKRLGAVKSLFSKRGSSGQGSGQACPNGRG